MADDRVDRCLVRATATRWLGDDPFPGVVEVQFAEHDGSLVTIHEKAAVLDAALDRTTVYPAELCLDALVVAVTSSSRLVRLLHGIEDLGGRAEFVVGSELTE